MYKMQVPGGKEGGQRLIRTRRMARMRTTRRMRTAIRRRKTMTKRTLIWRRIMRREEDDDNQNWDL